MVNYEALMDPSGGTGHGQKIFGSGFAAAIGIEAAHFSITHKFKKGSFYKNEVKRIRGLHAKDIEKSGYAVYRKHVKDVVRPAVRAAKATPGTAAKSARAFIEHERRQLKAAAKTVTRAQHTMLRANNAWFRGTVKGLRIMSAAFFASDMINLATSIMAPSPALSAKAQTAEASFGGQQAVFSGGMTSRQRAMQAIHDSQLAINPILGNEAQYLHS